MDWYDESLPIVVNLALLVIAVILAVGAGTGGKANEIPWLHANGGAFSCSGWALLFSAYLRRQFSDGD